MREYLLFRLYGPMASWGETAVGEVRPSAPWPGKSALLGLVGAALGIRRDEEELQRRLANAYRTAVRVESSGELLRDYHTTQVPPERRGVRHYTRRDELGAEKLHTILSQRDYRTDALYTVALWSKFESPLHTMEQLQQALKSPRFTLYLGRKSCPLAMPLQPSLVKARDLRSAFDEAVFSDGMFLERLRPSGEPIYVWETTPDPGMEAQHVNRRRDQPHSRRRWQFSERDENYRSDTVEEGV